MERTIKADSSFLTDYKRELDEIFGAYLEDIVPFIVLFETQKNEFPIELQNEIRAIYGHLARAAIAETPDQVDRNIQKMKSHTKRALLDCFKYSCVIFIDSYMNFFKRYESVDLSYLEDGQFLPKIHAQYNKAKTAYFEAKQAETSNLSEDQLFNLFQNAYNQFASLNEKLCSVEDSANFLKHKATRRDHLAIASFIVGVVGILVTVITAAVTLL